MSILETIVVALGGTALLVAAAAWLTKSVIAQWLSKDLERYKSELAATSTVEIERLRHELQLTAHERSVLIAKLHEKRTQVVADLYGLLVEAHWASQDFASPMEWAGEPTKKEKYGAALNKSADFYRFFDKNRIYLPDALCTQLDEFLRAIRGKVIGFGVYLSRDEALMSDDNIQKKHEAWIDTARYFDDEVPKARHALERELRMLVGVATSSIAGRGREVCSEQGPASGQSL
jgi:hypothetical protein